MESHGTESALHTTGSADRVTAGRLLETLSRGGWGAAWGAAETAAAVLQRREVGCSLEGEAKSGAVFPGSCTVLSSLGPIQIFS